MQKTHQQKFPSKTFNARTFWILPTALQSYGWTASILCGVNMRLSRFATYRMSLRFIRTLRPALKILLFWCCNTKRCYWQMRSVRSSLLRITSTVYISTCSVRSCSSWTNSRAYRFCCNQAILIGFFFVKIHCVFLLVSNFSISTNYFYIIWVPFFRNKPKNQIGFT